MTAPTPERRVGEGRAVLCGWCATAWHYSTPITGEDRDALVVEAKAHSLVCEKNPLVVRLAFLAAEVERLTKEKAEAVALADEALALGRVSDDQWCTKEGDRYDRVATRLAALSLPTPAPEATEKCPDCEGNGFYVTERTINECCGHGTPSGDCCGSPVAGVEQEQVACERCRTTGKVSAPPAPEGTDGK